MDFWKMNGNGNDFVVIVNREGLGAAGLADLARRVCRRRSSIGADGLLVLESLGPGNFRMDIFNSDGSRGEMCGNGARCAARYACLNGMAPLDMVFQTLAGPVGARVDGSFVDLRMGLRDGFSFRTLNFSLDRWPGEPQGDFAVVGVPHFVVYPGSSREVSKEDMVLWGRTLRKNRDLFPKGTNVDFCRVREDGAISVVTYERGVEDLTDSCGTGSAASALAAAERFGLAFPLDVLNPGGINRVSVKDGEVILRGNTAIVARGTIEKEA